MSPIKNDDLLNVAVEAGLAASNIIMEALGEPRIADYKGKTDLVTVTDHQSENTIKSIISSYFSDHNFLAEESGKDSTGSEYIWIIDPLDGTTNFVHGYPSFAVSIGLFYKNEPLVAVVVEMPHTKLYSAVTNEGALCEGRPIACSETFSVDKSLLITGFGYEHGDLWEQNMTLFKHFTNTTQGVRRLGAAAVDICHVASGQADGFWEYDLKPWDTAAGLLIAKEAGCVISNMAGNQYSIYDDNILIANPHIHKKLLKEIKSIRTDL